MTYTGLFRQVIIELKELCYILRQVTSVVFSRSNFIPCIIAIKTGRSVMEDYKIFHKGIYLFWNETF